MLLSENFFKLLHLFLIAVSDLPITAFSKSYDLNHIYICTALSVTRKMLPVLDPLVSEIEVELKHDGILFG